MDSAKLKDQMILGKVAVFDMDNTILRTSFIDTAASVYGFKEQLEELKTNNNPFIRTKLIARLLIGKSMSDLLELTDKIDITPGLPEIMGKLKRKGYLAGIISDSYDCVTKHLKDKHRLEFAFSNELEFSNGYATGEVKISPLFVSGENNQCKHDYCKLNALIKICGFYKVDLKNTLMIGDGENDICCIRKAGVGVSFCSSSNLVDSVADHVIKEPDFQLLIPILE